MDHRTRLHRPRGYNDPGHAHELTYSCYRRFPLLSKDRSCQWLADAIDSTRQELNYALWAYIIMPDHFHLIVWLRDRTYDDSEFLKRFKEPVSREAMRYLRAHAPEWLTPGFVCSADSVWNIISGNQAAATIGTSLSRTPCKR